MKKRYFVDWTDPPFPEIKPIELAWNPDIEHAYTFTQCKQEIIEKLQADIDFARNQIRWFRRLRVKDIGNET